MPPALNKQVPFRERSELLDFLLEVATSTSQSLDLDQLLETVAQHIQRVLHYELFAILLYSERTKQLSIRFAIGHRSEVVKNLRIKLGEGLTGAAAATREPILVGDVRNDDRYLNSLDAVRSELAVPMIARQRLVGVIDIQSSQTDAYSEYDRAMLRLIASRVASTIDNARLYRRVERQNRTLRALGHISREFAAILEIDELLAKIASTMRDLINYDAFSILLVDEASAHLKHKFSIRYDERVKLDNIPLGKGITGAAAQSREPVRVGDTSQDPRYIVSHPEARSEVAIPLIVRDIVVGVMDLESNRLNYFTDDHMRLLALLAPQIATSVENARLYAEIAEREKAVQDDLQAASELQSVLLPAEPPPIAGIDAAIGLRPARKISGDLFDFYEHRVPGRRSPQTVIAFGDSSGKGAAAALYGAVVSGLMRTLAPRRPGPAGLMRALNEKLVERKVEARYVTLLLMLWQPHSREFRIANAGGVTPVICRGGKILDVKAEGVPLGLLPDREYEEAIFRAQPGDLVVLCSDGVTDHMSPEGEEFGRERIGRIISEACQLGPHGVVQTLFDELDRFNTVKFDDQTILALRVKPTRRPKS
jgi:sigma-B regulation protein RsbU (phosphoserine phosphatase)